MISIAMGIANDKKHRDCQCFSLVLEHIDVASLVCIILEYSHNTKYQHPYARDGDLCIHADVTPYRSVCRRTRDIRHSNANNYVPRAIVSFTEINDLEHLRDGNKRNLVIFTAYFHAPRQKDVAISHTIDLDQGYMRFLFDPHSSPKALLDMIQHSASSKKSDTLSPPCQKITVSMATMFFKACIIARDELCEIIYEIHHKCPLTAQRYA